MSDHFLSIPDQIIGSTMFPQDAVDWLAFGPPERGARSSLSLDDQILCGHRAAGTLLMAIWGSDLPTYVRSPSLAAWYQIPAAYWGRQTPESMQAAIKRPDIPDRLPRQPRPLDARYEVDIVSYPHSLPASDLVGQIIAFRRAEVERYCSIAKPVYQWKLKAPNASTGSVERWSESEMSKAIRTWTERMSTRDRERAWRDHFKALAVEHGWDNRSFRDHWSIALASEGQPGRPKSSP